MSHTPEPWMLFEVGDRFKHQCPASSDRTSILTIATEDDVQFGAVYSDEDARRIVACINACQGSKTEDLERLGKDFIAPLIELIDQRDKLLTVVNEAENITVDSIKRMRAAHVGCADLTRRVEDLLQTIKRLKVM